MRGRLVYWHARTLFWHRASWEAIIAVVLVVIFFADPTSAMRLQDRSLYMNSSSAGATTFYRISWRYMSPSPIGSVEMLFCEDPIPYTECVTPEGMDVSRATLSAQAGEDGFAISTQSTNRIVISRSSSAITHPSSSYTFDGIINPKYSGHAFAIRLATFSTRDATGEQIDFGSMRGEITEGVEIQTQVPPMLIFCLARQVRDNCTGTDDVYYTDMGELSANSTLTAESQMAVGTNASAGFVITANGPPLSAGTNVIEAIEKPSESIPGKNQFGINLVENTTPQVGKNPEGEWANAVAADEYSRPDKYKFSSGDAVAYSQNVSLMKKFTVSYIVNSSNALKAGIYTTTINFIASGRF